MADTFPIASSMQVAQSNNAHLRAYLEEWRQRTGRVPEFQVSLSRDVKDAAQVDVLYPVGDPIFIHVHGNEVEGVKYTAVEPHRNE